MEQTSVQDWAERAKTVFPGGGFGNFDPEVTITRGEGARVWDDKGNVYVDYLIGSGPLVIGHSHPEVKEVVFEQLHKGSTYFANNPSGIELAEEICRAVACADQVRFMSTGTEATMYALRLARAYTKREKILKFEGGFHGMSSEGLMSLYPSTLTNYPLAIPDSPGIPESIRDQVLVAPFNDLESATGIIREYEKDLAAIIVEPLQRLIPPEPGFLEGLRAVTEELGIVLIFDEIVTGFRLEYGGAQSRYGVVPDLCALGKIIGGGFPLAAVAGKKKLMDHFDKEISGEDGFLLQYGTLNGNPVAAVAGLKTLEILRRPGSYEKLRQNGEQVMSAIRKNLQLHEISHQIMGDPVMFDVVFTDSAVKSYADMLKADAKRSRRFWLSLREQRVIKSDNKFYISIALTDDDLSFTEEAIREACRTLASG